LIDVKGYLMVTCPRCSTPVGEAHRDYQAMVATCPNCGKQFVFSEQHLLEKKSKAPAGLKVRYSGDDLLLTVPDYRHENMIPAEGCISIGIVFFILLVIMFILRGGDWLGFALFALVLTVIPIGIGWIWLQSSNLHVRVTGERIEIYRDSFGRTDLVSAFDRIKAIYTKEISEQYSNIKIEIEGADTQTPFPSLKHDQAEYLARLIQTQLRLEDFSPFVDEMVMPEA
jgi:DNA-directed RNA polymerase subunit RPC12/RpoP